MLFLKATNNLKDANYIYYKMSIDIVNLIEQNSNIQLNDNGNKLIEKIKNQFTNYEQQLFLSSFYCFLSHDPNNDFIIDLDNVWKWLGFNQKVKAKALLESHFKVNIHYQKLLSRLGKQDDKIHGGHNKEIFMLNINTFKKFCLKAGTQKADEVHDYFIKMEQIVLETNKEENEELRQQIQQIKNIKDREMENRIMYEKSLEREKTLLEKYASSGSLVYIIKVMSYQDGTYVIKIGESRLGIKNRYDDHKQSYDECVLLDCFPIEKSKNFEKFLHQHPKIRSNKVKNLEKHENENELFLVGKELTYKMITDIIQQHKNNYNYNVNDLLNKIEMLETKIEMLETKIEMLETENRNLKSNIYTNTSTTTSTNSCIYQSDISLLISNNQKLVESNNTLTESNRILSEKIASLERTICDSKPKEVKMTTGFNTQLPQLGPRLQKINPETMQLLKVYDSVTEAMNEDKHIKRPSIMKAIRENTVYCGFRWFLVERNLDANILIDVPPTKQTKQQNLGYIAKLDREKTQILNVYLDRKTAAQINGYQSISALDNPVKNGTISNGHYYMVYDSCNKKLIADYEAQHGPPVLYKDGVGQFDEDNQLVAEFTSKYDCIKEMKMSDKTLAKALDKDVTYNNFYYKTLGSKLQHLP